METGSSDFSARLAGVAQETDALLGQLLADAPLEGEIARPPRLLAAMRHAVLGGEVEHLSAGHAA